MDEMAISAKTRTTKESCMQEMIKDTNHARSSGLPNYSTNEEVQERSGFRILNTGNDGVVVNLTKESQGVMYYRGQ